MSIFLQNYVQLLEGARAKPLQPVIRGGFELLHANQFSVQLSYIQCFIMLTTVVLIAAFTLMIARTPLGRAQRACEQDRTMAALLGVDVDRTISLTFVIGAALAAVAGVMVTMYYGVIGFFIRLLGGVEAVTPPVPGGLGPP